MRTFLTVWHSEALGFLKHQVNDVAHLTSSGDDDVGGPSTPTIFRPMLWPRPYHSYRGPRCRLRPLGSSLLSFRHGRRSDKTFRRLPQFLPNELLWSEFSGRLFNDHAPQAFSISGMGYPRLQGWTNLRHQRSESYLLRTAEALEFVASSMAWDHLIEMME